MGTMKDEPASQPPTVSVCEPAAETEGSEGSREPVRAATEVEEWPVEEDGYGHGV